MSPSARIKITCEIKTSPRCKKTYFTSASNIKSIKKKNNGKMICRYCSFALKYTGRKNPNCKYLFDDNFFETINTIEKAYLLGWIASDGHIGQFGFTITIHGDDRKCLEKLKNIICKDIPIIEFYDQKYHHTNVRFNINSAKISQDLCRHLGIVPGNKSYTVKFPNLSETLIYHFVRGYFEGDGTITNPLNGKKSPVIGITSRSEHILNGLRNLGIQCYGNWRWVYWSSSHAMQLLSKIYSETFLILDRKYKRYMQWQKIYVPNGNVGENHHSAKLSEKQVIRILHDKKNGFSDTDIAQIYGVSRSSINDIITGKTWKKVPRV